MRTIDWGYEVPETGDAGNVFGPGIERDIEKLADHEHDGVLNAKIKPVNFDKPTGTAPSGSWAAFESGYKQTVTLPTDYEFDTTQIFCRFSTGEYFEAPIEKLSDTTFEVFINDNTITLNFLYY